jgi:choice-of-anchor C domain-containing protein
VDERRRCARTFDALPINPPSTARAVGDKTAVVHLKQRFPFTSICSAKHMVRRPVSFFARLVGVCSLTAMTAIAVSRTVSASPIENIVVNGGFESTVVTPGEVSPPTTQLDGWTVPHGDVEVVNWNGTGYWQSHSGSQSLDLSGCQNGAIKQLMATVVGQQYTLRYWIAPSPDAPGIKYSTARVGTAPGRTDLSYAINMLDSATSTRTTMGWVERSATFTATTSLTWLYFNDFSDTACFGTVIDDITVVPIPVQVPQFKMYGLVAVGMATAAWALAASTRKKRVA